MKTELDYTLGDRIRADRLTDPAIRQDAWTPGPGSREEWDTELSEFVGAHTLQVSCGPFGTRCGLRHLPEVKYSCPCGELPTWCIHAPR